MIHREIRHFGQSFRGTSRPLSGRRGHLSVSEQATDGGLWVERVISSEGDEGAAAAVTPVADWVDLGGWGRHAKIPRLALLLRRLESVF